MPASSYAAQIDRFQNYGYPLYRAPATLPATTTTTYFTVTGEVEITLLEANVTTAVQAQANAVNWVFTPTGGSVGNMCATVDINGAAVGARIIVQSPTAAGALSQAALLLQTTGASANTLRTNGGIIVKDGAIGFKTAATNTGATEQRLRYRPISPGASVSVA